MYQAYPIKQRARCGADFKVTKPNKIFCSLSCQIAERNEKQKKQRQRQRPTWEPKPCAWCGKSFSPTDKRELYCSIECKKARAQAAARARRRADTFAAFREVNPPGGPKLHSPVCPNPRCSWLKYEGYGKGFCVRPVCIYSQRAGKK